MTRAHKVLDLLREAMPEYIEWHKVDPYKLMVLERMLKCWDRQIEYMGKLRKQGIQNRSKHSHFIRKHVTFTETQCRAWNVYVSPSPKNKDS